jgi:hypothetical protein
MKEEGIGWFRFILETEKERTNERKKERKKERRKERKRGRTKERKKREEGGFVSLCFRFILVMESTF